MNTCSILVAGNNADKRAELRGALESEGHQVAETGTADGTLRSARSGLHQLLMLASGFEPVKASELCRVICRESKLGIIVLTGDSTRQDHIDALNAGADDYLASPFVHRELLARVRAVLRRVETSNNGKQVMLQDRVIDFGSHEIGGPGNRVSHLTPKEVLVLQYLVANKAKTLSCKHLAQTIWHRDGTGEVEYVRVVIRQIKQKLEPDPARPRYILTQRSVGYRFEMPAARQIVGTKPHRSYLPLAGPGPDTVACRSDSPATAQ